MSKILSTIDDINNSNSGKLHHGIKNIASSSINKHNLNIANECDGSDTRNMIQGISNINIITAKNLYRSLMSNLFVCIQSLQAKSKL